jgi:hypothetical protein
VPATLYGAGSLGDEDISPGFLEADAGEMDLIPLRSNNRFRHFSIKLSNRSRMFNS